MANPNIGTDTRKNGGAFDLVIVNGASSMGFILANKTTGVKQQVSNTAPTFSTGEVTAYNQDAFRAIAWLGTADGGDKDLLVSGERRFNLSNGGVATQYDDYLTLASQWNSTDATQTATCRKIIDYPVGNQYVLVGVGTKCRAYNLNSQTWANSGTFANSVIDLCTDGTYVWAAVGASEAYWRLNNTSWSQPASGVKATCFAMFKEKLHRALGRNLFVSSDLGGSSGGWGVAVPVGWASTNILDMFVGGTLLLIAKPEGLFGYDGTSVKLLVDTKTTVSTGNFIGGCEAFGRVYAPHLQEVLEIGVNPNNSISGTSGITARQTGSAAKERYWHGTPKVCVAAPKALYVAFHQGQGTYPEILQYNGRGGWHQVYLGSSSTNMNAFGFSQLLGWLIVNDGSTRYKRVTNVGSSEYPDFASSGYVESPKIDGGYPLLPKLWRSVQLDVQSLDADETVKVSYSVDGGAYVDVETLVTNVPAEVILGGSGGQVEGRTIQIKLTLARGSDITLTPRVKWPVIINGLPAAKATDMTTYEVIIDERTRTRIGATLGDYASTQAYDEFLDDIRESASTLAVANQHNKWSSMRVTNFVALPKTVAGKPGAAPREYFGANITMLDMFPGLERTVENVALITCATSTEAA